MECLNAATGITQEWNERLCVRVDHISQTGALLSYVGSSVRRYNRSTYGSDWLVAVCMVASKFRLARGGAAPTKPRSLHQVGTFFNVSIAPVHLCPCVQVTCTTQYFYKPRAGRCHFRERGVDSLTSLLAVPTPSRCCRTHLAAATP
jgi:hypothetical protein